MFPNVLVSQLSSGHSGTRSGFPSLSCVFTRFTSEVSCTRLHCPSLSALGARNERERANRLLHARIAENSICEGFDQRLSYRRGILVSARVKSGVGQGKMAQRSFFRAVRLTETSHMPGEEQRNWSSTCIFCRDKGIMCLRPSKDAPKRSDP